MTADKPFPLNVAFLISLLLHAGLFGNIWSAQHSKAEPIAFPDVWDATPVEVWNEPENEAGVGAEPAKAAPEARSDEQAFGLPSQAGPQPRSQAEQVRPEPESRAEPAGPEPELARQAAKASPSAVPVQVAASARAGQPASDTGRKSAPRATAITDAPPAHAKGSTTSATPQPAPSAPASDADSASVGMVGLPAGMRHFAKAFARALPAGCFADPGWSELPLGPVGRAIFAVHIDETGRIERLELDPDLTPPPIVKRMIERAMLLLKSGTFSLEPSRVSAGTEWLELSVTLSQAAPHSDSDADGRHLQAEGHETPTWQRAGRGYFTLNSGLHMEASLRLLRR